MAPADVLADPRDASVQAMFEAAGALRRGHFALKSGRHSDRYLEKFAVLQYPTLAVEIGRRLAESLAAHDPTLVVGPTTGGVLLAFETARHLQDSLGHTVRGIFAEPVGPGQRALRRGWQVHGDDRIVLVDDILTSGASVRETVEAVAAAGGRPLAATVIVDRATAPVDVGVPLRALARIEIASWEADGCPLCAANVTLEKPGSS
ncbi:MAG TPA: orotate phosphoribosyltransferase [Candidatus Limnocylindria bacterium]|nr:orotate phosphoribosyltransferase [Candidatus Limnocylindria bacterium]